MHADHITGTGYLKQLLPSVQSVISGKSGAQADKYLEDGDMVQFGRHEIKAVTTPGHTNGCMTYINYEQVKCLTFGLIWEYSVSVAVTRFWSGVGHWDTGMRV